MIKQLKTKARRDFQCAKKNGALVDDMQALEEKKFNLVRQQSKMAKKSRAESVLNPSDKNEASVIILFGSMQNIFLMIILPKELIQLSQRIKLFHSLNWYTALTQCLFTNHHGCHQLKLPYLTLMSLLSPLKRSVAQSNDLMPLPLHLLLIKFHTGF